ncbi:MAG: TolC family outer membrane protein [Betaproteobacteria bacterium]|jgi:outer membrane protein|nr:TolC family outer membrane protein [Betaproteobacteria bacterium]
MKRIRFALLGLAVAAALAGPVRASDLLEVYNQAKGYDAAFAAAQAALDAGKEKYPQGLAGLLPNVAGSANTFWNRAEVPNGTIPDPDLFTFNSNGWTVQLTQPIFRWQNWEAFKQGELQVVQAEATFGAAGQDLVVRVAQAYFDVLQAGDNLDFVKANKTAIAEQLAQAKRNFEVGTATITDTNEAQARFDLAYAQEIAAINDLEVKKRALQLLIGDVPATLAPLRTTLQIDSPDPNNMDEWVARAQDQNFQVRAQQAAVEIAKREVGRQRAGHYPTVDLVGNVSSNTNQNLAILAPRRQVDQTQIGLQLNLPIFSGGSVLSRTREAAALSNKALSDLDAVRRTAVLDARRSFLNVSNGLAQVKALEQALVSSETSLQSNRVGYEVGVRINLDVLNAVQQVFSTKRDLAKARYDTIINGFKLKQAAGNLTEDDIQRANALLVH